MTAHGWTATADALPEDGERVLAFVQGNRVLLPGKEAMELNSPS